MAAQHYRSAELVFGWSFYRQGSSGSTSSADEFLDAVLTWFGDPDPRIGTPWEKGAHARKVMESYQTWLGEGPELSVLRILGLFDRPADETALETLLKPPAIWGLTESLVNLSSTEWRTIIARLRRTKLLAGQDPHDPGDLDTHPLVREYFGEQLRSQRADAWKECNRRLYSHYRAIAPQLPDSFRDMEPLFLAVICGCNAGLFHEALHEVYIPRIQRGNASFAGNVLGARGALLSVLIHFFAHGNWKSPLEIGFEEQRLTVEDQLFILMQAGIYLMATRGLGAPEARICYERAESLCHSVNRPRLLYVALVGQWRYSLITGKLTTTMRLADKIYSLARKQNDSALMIGAYRALTDTLYYSGDFEAARQYAMCGVRIWRLGDVESKVEELDEPAITCLCLEALCAWHSGEISSCHAPMAEAIALARELSDMHGLAAALYFASILGQMERNPGKVERLASDLIELSTRQRFAQSQALGTIFLGWARSVSGSTVQGISCIEDGIENIRQAEGCFACHTF